MSKLFLALLASTLVSIVGPAHADSSADNQKLLKRLQASRTGTEWNCTRGTNKEAVVLFDVKDSSILSGGRILVIKDPQICKNLNVTAPFVASFSENTFDLVGPAKFGYWATRGQNEDTVLFYSQGQGMNLVSIDNGSQPAVSKSPNWFFNSGECVKH